ncbi:hypothetical protein [Sphingomonas morindae]|uniref:PepSY domain-containing protein n=1 Tax=Sphingomonas morindae TaxID=1541170 RepID=A0ABY4XAU9_9SPHN|nr:hypothetical protein [Sphingomonas morindae]USI74010.1 hypothetical protein LHA26_05975 [Sphingomonas morindae]
MIAAPVEAGPRRPFDQDRAREDVRAGGRPLREIQNEWRQSMPGYDFLGSDYDPDAGRYRLKFMRGNAVDWVDVDGRTGREVGRAPRR